MIFLFRCRGRGPGALGCWLGRRGIRVVEWGMGEGRGGWIGLNAGEPGLVWTPSCKTSMLHSASTLLLPPLLSSSPLHPLPSSTAHLPSQPPYMACDMPVHSSSVLCRFFHTSASFPLLPPILVAGTSNIELLGRHFSPCILLLSVISLLPVSRFPFPIYPSPLLLLTKRVSTSTNPKHPPLSLSPLYPYHPGLIHDP